MSGPSSVLFVLPCATSPGVRHAQNPRIRLSIALLTSLRLSRTLIRRICKPGKGWTCPDLGDWMPLVYVVYKKKYPLAARSPPQCHSRVQGEMSDSYSRWGRSFQECLALHNNTFICNQTTSQTWRASQASILHYSMKVSPQGMLSIVRDQHAKHRFSQPPLSYLMQISLNYFTLCATDSMQGTIPDFRPHIYESVNIMAIEDAMRATNNEIRNGLVFSTPNHTASSLLQTCTLRYAYVVSKSISNSEF